MVAYADPAKSTVY